MYNQGFNLKITFPSPTLCSDNFWLHPFSPLPQSLLSRFTVLIINYNRLLDKALVFFNILETSFRASFLRPLHTSAWKRELGVTQWVLAHTGSHVWVLCLGPVHDPEDNSLCSSSEMLLKVINIRPSFSPFYYSGVVEIKTGFQFVYWKLSLNSGGNTSFFPVSFRNLPAVVTAWSLICINLLASRWHLFQFTLYLVNREKEKRKRRKNTEPLN